MSPIPVCRFCGLAYCSTTEQQSGFNEDIYIKTWICKGCFHKKSVYSKEDLSLWDSAEKFCAEKTEQNFEYTFSKEVNPQYGSYTKEHDKCDDCQCDSDKKDKPKCNGSCGHCKGH